MEIVNNGDDSYGGAQVQSGLGKGKNANVFRIYISTIWPRPCAGEILLHRSSVGMDAILSPRALQGQCYIVGELNLLNQPLSGSEPR